MAATLELRKIGNSEGFTLPSEELARLKLGAGDEVFLISEPDGLRIESYDPEFAKEVRVYEAGAKQYRNALRELAR
jgi:putative addiction module antidote